MPSQDTRIVEMQFDNRQFEKNIAKSQKSLEDFKKELDFEETGRGLEKFSEQINILNFGNMAENLQKLTDKFTGLGNAGEYVLSRIRHSIESAAYQLESFIKSFTSAQITVGQSKYDSLTKAVQTIVASGKYTEQEAYGYMERVMEYTNQTSHSFSTMVGQISNLTSIGTSLGEAERLVEAMGNAATFAGGSAEQAAISMGVLTKAISSNFLGYEQFLQLNNTARVITDTWRKQALEAGVAVGTLIKKNDKFYTQVKGQKSIEVTAENLQNTLRTRWMNSDVIKFLYGNYKFGDSLEELKHPEKAVDSFGRTAYLTGQRALTFADAMNAVKESVSSGWMQTFRLTFGDLNDAMVLFTNLCNGIIDALERIQKFRNDLLGGWSHGGGRKSLIQSILGDYGEDIETGAYGLLDIFNDMSDVLAEGFWNMLKIFAPDDVRNMWDELDSAGRSWKMNWLTSVIIEATQNVQLFMQSVRDFFNEEVSVGGEVVTRLDMIKQVVDGISGSLILAFQIASATEYFVSGLIDRLQPSFLAIGNIFSSLGTTIYDSAENAYKGQGMIKFVDDLLESLTPLIDAVNLLVPALADFVIQFMQWGIDSGFFMSVLNGISGAVNTIAKVVSAVGGPIIAFFGTLFETFTDLIENNFNEESLGRVGSALKGAISTLFKSILESLPESMSGIRDAIKDLFGLWDEGEGLERDNIFTRIHDFFKNGLGSLSVVIDSIKNAFANWNLSAFIKSGFGFGAAFNFLNTVVGWFKSVNLYSVIMAFLGVFAVVELIKLVHQAGKAWENIRWFFDDVGNNFKKGFLGDYEWFSDRMINIAKALLYLVGAVVLLGGMNTGSMIQGVLGLTAVMGAMLGFMWILNKVQATHMTQVITTGAFGAFAASVAILVTALLPLTAVNWEGYARMMAGLGGVLLQLIGFMLLTTYLPIGTRQLGGFIGFAFSLAILMTALIPLSFVSWAGYARMMAGLGGVLTQLIGFMLLTSYLPIGTGQLGRFIGFAASISLLVLALIPLAAVSWAGYARMMAGLGGVLLQLVGFMLLLNYLPITTDQLGKFIGFAASIAILVFALAPLAAVSWEGYAKMMAGLGGVLAQLIGFMLLTSYLPIGTGQLGGFIAFALSLAILVQALLPFSNMNWGQYAQMMAGLGGILLELVGFMWLTKKLSLFTDINLGGFIGFAASIAIILLALQPFGNMSAQGYQQAIMGLAAVLIEIIGFMALLKEMKPDMSDATAGLVMMIGLAITMAIFSFALNEVKNVNWEIIAAFSAGLSGLILSFAGAIAILSKIGLVSGIKGIILLVLGIAAVIGVISAIIPMMIGSIGSSVTNFSSRLELISGMIEGFSDRMGRIDEGNIDKAGSIFDKLKSIVAKLSGWGNFTGKIDNFSYAMYSLGTGIEIFNRHAGNALGTLDGNTEAAVGFIESLSNCASGLDAIATMNMDLLIGKISALGGALYIFAKGTKEAEGIEIGETPDISGGLRIIQALSEALNENGGITIPSDLPSADEFTTFGAKLAALATGLVLFEEAGFGLGNGTKKALQTLDFFRQIKAKLIATEFEKGLLTAIGVFSRNNVDKDTLTQFGNNIEQLGLSLKAFAESVTVTDAKTGEMKDLNFDNAIKALESFAALDKSLDIDFGPLLQVVVGRKKDLTDLSSEIELLGTALSDFNSKLSGVDENGNVKFDKKIFDDALAVAKDIADYLKELQSKFDNVGGLINIVSTVLAGRDFDFTDLKTQLVALGEGLRSLDGINTEDGSIKIFTKEDFSKEGGIADLLDALLGYMKTLKTKVDRVGGFFNVLATALIGRNFDFTDLETQLKALGSGLNALSGLNKDDSKILTVDETAPIFDLLDALLSYMKTLRTKVGTVGGYYRVIDTALFGRSFDFTDLKTQLQALGDGLNSISGLNIDSEGHTIFNADGRSAALDTVDALMTYMRSLGTKIGRVGGLGEWFQTLLDGKEADFEYVGTQLGYLGDGMGKFSKGLIGEGVYDGAAVDSALAALDNIVSIIQKMRTFSDDFYTVSDGINKFDTPLRMENMSEWVARMADLMRYLSNSTAVNPNAPNIINSLVDFIWQFDDALNEKGGLHNLQSADILNQLTSSIVNLVSATKGLTLEDGSLADFSIIGLQICNGVVSGIEEGTSSVSEAAKSMALSAYTAALKALDIGSPSKLFMEIGRFTSAGMALGIKNGTPGVTNASTLMSESALDAAADVITAITPLIADELDGNPTITPVLDLDNVNRQLDYLDQRFDTTGQFGKGNIDLNNRQVVHNPDGSISTERSFSVNIDGLEVLLPTVIGGKIVDEDTAIDHYYKTGEHLGKFNTWQEADAYAEMLHQRQEWYYGGQQPFAQSPQLNTEALYQFASKLTGDLAAINQNPSKVDFTGIYDRMATMGRQITDMGRAITNMKIVLNNDVIAGGVTDGVDANLGRRMFYAGRNN